MLIHQPELNNPGIVIQGATVEKQKFPRWFQPFEQPARYKIAYGGRGSSKSWTYARALLLKAVTDPLRILCARELQVSIKDSVYKLLCDQIERLDLEDEFEVGKSYIRSKAGAEFIFKGLRHNYREIKSMEGIDICWCEEADLISHDSWEVLIPTIRTGKVLGDDTEIWLTFNPENKTDSTYVRFVLNTPPNSVIAKVNWMDNPWFPKVLEMERLHMQATDIDAYNHVWGGNCLERSDAQVLNGKWVVDIFEPQDHWDGAYFGADWGFSQDPTTLNKMWIHDGNLYIEYEANGVGVEIDETDQLFDEIPGSRLQTIRADSARPETISYMNRNGFKVIGAIKGAGSVVEGIKHLRSFKKIIIHPRCKHTIQEAKLWSYKVDRITKEVLPVLVDKFNHHWDGIRYALELVMKSKKILIG